MIKKKFDIYTKETYSFIPANVIIIRNKYGWVFMYSGQSQWYVNHTNDNKNCTEKELEKFLRTLVKAIKGQIALTPEKAPKPVE